MANNEEKTILEILVNAVQSLAGEFLVIDAIESQGRKLIGYVRTQEYRSGFRFENNYNEILNEYSSSTEIGWEGEHTSVYATSHPVTSDLLERDNTNLGTILNELFEFSSDTHQVVAHLVEMLSDRKSSKLDIPDSPEHYRLAPVWNLDEDLIVDCLKYIGDPQSYSLDPETLNLPVGLFREILRECHIFANDSTKKLEATMITNYELWNEINNLRDTIVKLDSINLESRVESQRKIDSLKAELETTREDAARVLRDNAQTTVKAELGKADEVTQDLVRAAGLAGPSKVHSADTPRPRH